MKPEFNLKFYFNFNEFLRPIFLHFWNLNIIYGLFKTFLKLHLWQKFQFLIVLRFSSKAYSEWLWKPAVNWETGVSIPSLGKSLTPGFVSINHVYLTQDGWFADHINKNLIQLSKTQNNYIRKYHSQNLTRDSSDDYQTQKQCRGLL